MKYFCKNANKTAIGSVAIVEAAIAAAPLRWPGIRLAEIGKAHSQHLQAAVLHDHQRPEKRTPAPDENQDAEAGHGRHQQGQDDTQEDVEFSGTIHPRRFQQFVRQVGGVLPHHEHPERVHHPRHDQPDITVLPPERMHLHEQWNDQNLERDHHGRDNEKEQQAVRHGNRYLANPNPAKAPKNTVTATCTSDRSVLLNR